MRKVLSSITGSARPVGNPLLRTYRLQLSEEKIRRRLQRLDKRLLKVASQLQTLKTE